MAAAVLLHLARNGDISITSDGIIVYMVIVLMILVVGIVTDQSRR